MREGEPRCEAHGCNTAVTHAQYNESRDKIRWWCEAHVPQQHARYCPEPCSQLILDTTGDVTEEQIGVLRRFERKASHIVDTPPVLESQRALLRSWERRGNRIKVLEKLCDDMTAQRAVYREEARALRAERDAGLDWHGNKCGHFIVIRDYDALVKQTEEACRRTAVPFRLSASDRIEALAKEIERLRKVILDEGTEKHCDHAPSKPTHADSGQRLFVQEGQFPVGKLVEVAVCKHCGALYLPSKT